jgi:hypothetical protein
VCCRFSPNGLSRGSASLFRSAVRVSDFKFGTAEHINDAGGMGMHWLLFPWFESVFEHTRLIVFPAAPCNIGATF